MTNGLMNVIAPGTSGLFLTACPQITYLKPTYRRITNFAKASVDIPCDKCFSFDSTIEIICPKYADLVMKPILNIEIPEMLISKCELMLSNYCPKICNENILCSQNEYNLIIEFMKINTCIYREIYTYIEAENVNCVDDIINIILKQFEEHKQLSTDYNCLLRKYNLDYTGTNLECVLKSLYNCNKCDFKLYVDGAICKCIEIQGFFFDKLNCAKKVNCDILNPNAKFAWNENLGEIIIDYFDIYIGSAKINRIYCSFIDIWHQLTSYVQQDCTYNKMVGNVPEMTCYNSLPKPKYILNIPLPVWFTKPNSALPICCLIHNDLKFVFKLRKIEQCGYVEGLVISPPCGLVNVPEYYGNGTGIPSNSYIPEIMCNNLSLSNVFENKNIKLTCSLSMEYIFLDCEERQRFIQTSHEYLIPEIQRNQIVLPYSNTIATIPLDFKGPCKEIMWTIQKQAYVNNIDGIRQNNFTFYGLNKDTIAVKDPFRTNIYTNIGWNKNPMISAHLNVNNLETEDKNSRFYNEYVPDKYHTRIPKPGINVYSFSIYPEDQQQLSGQLNLNMIKYFALIMKIRPEMFYYRLSDIYNLPQSIPDNTFPTDLLVNVYAVSQNVLRISNGYGGNAYG